MSLCLKNKKEYFEQFILLSLTFCSLVILIHLIYGSLASLIKNNSKSNNYFKYINIIGGSAYHYYCSQNKHNQHT